VLLDCRSERGWHLARVYGARFDGVDSCIRFAISVAVTQTCVTESLDATTSVRH